MPDRELSIDVLIFGGGIAGLWTLARLRREGYSCLLVESCQLGTGQTIASQGIIHGGIKYALTGRGSRASQAIAEMPEVWRACLRGEGELDLRSVKVLSERQYLWTTSGIASRLAGFAASLAIRTPVESVPPEARPEWLRGAPAGVQVYCVDEPVLEPRSLIRALADIGGEGILRGGGDERARDHPGHIREEQGTLALLGTRMGVWGNFALRAAACVLCAGKGNAQLLCVKEHDRLCAEAARMQLRPLQMVMARAQHYRPPLPPVFGHCLGAGERPRLTITSQTDAHGATVWYIGGDIAERGAQMAGPELAAEAQRELAACMPWIDISGTQWATLRVDRAEGSARGERPAEPVVRREGRNIVVWPTKLAFAPKAAEMTSSLLREMGVMPTGPVAVPDDLARIGRPSIADLPWEQTGVAWT